MPRNSEHQGKIKRELSSKTTVKSPLPPPERRSCWPDRAQFCVAHSSTLFKPPGSQHVFRIAAISAGDTKEHQMTLRVEFLGMQECRMSPTRTSDASLFPNEMFSFLLGSPLAIE